MKSTFSFEKLAFIFILTLVASSLTFSQIANSKHDLSSGSTTSGPKSSNVDEICVFCHTPHSNQSVELLWNRQSPTATYTVYSSSTMEQTPGQPTDRSKMCLSCHDGTVALNAIYNGPGAGSGTTPTFAVGDTVGKTNSFALIGVDLSNDHPVSIVYSTHQSTDNGLRAATTSNGKPVVSYGGITLPLYGTSTSDAKLECATCHDPHNTSTANFLRVSNTGSQLCLTCHNK